MAKVRSSSQLVFFPHYSSVLAFSFGFYTSNQFSELSLIHFRKGQMKIRNVLFTLFCRFVCFCCHHSLLIKIQRKILKVSRYLGSGLIKIQCLIKQDSVSPFFFASQRILHNMILLYYISQRSYIFYKVLHRDLLLHSFLK